MMSVYDEYLVLLQNFEDVCDVDGTTCELEKNMFGKLTIEVTEKVEGVETETTIVLKKGKLLSASVDSEGYDLSYEFDYGNQTVKAPSNKSDYKPYTGE